jgi:hypothetical protein
MDVWKVNSLWYQPAVQNSKLVPFAVEKVKLQKGKELYQVNFSENLPFVILITEVLLSIP